MNHSLFLVAYFVAYLLAIFGGWVVCGIVYAHLAQFVGLNRGAFSRIALIVGGTERAVVITLVLWAPAYVAGFIGGWMVLKLAAGWRQRGASMAGADYESDDHRMEASRNHEVGQLLALVISVISFAIGIGIGLALDNSAIEFWSSTAGG